jgi:integrase
MVLPLVPTEVPGVYRRGSKYVVVYRVGGRQRKQYADSLGEARAVKLERDGEARALRRGPTLHTFSLAWLDRYAGTGRDSVRANTRREYRRLLINFALAYFDREVRVRDLDRATVQHFVDWLTTRPGRDGRLCDRSIANALTPLRLTLDAAVADGLLDANPATQVVLPRRRSGRAWSTPERRYLTRAELVRLLDEVPAKWRPLFELLAATGLRVSEAVGLRWTDLVLDGPRPHACAAGVMVPAAERAGLIGVGFHTLRHTCASMLIESGLSPLRLQRWMGHHSAAFTLETYGHLIDGDMGPPLDLRAELRQPAR